MEADRYSADVFRDYCDGWFLCSKLAMTILKLPILLALEEGSINSVRYPILYTNLWFTIDVYLLSQQCSVLLDVVEYPPCSSLHTEIYTIAGSGEIKNRETLWH